MSTYSDYEAGYETALQHVADGEVEVPAPTPVLTPAQQAEQYRAAQQRRMEPTPAQRRSVQLGMASVALRLEPGNAVEATRDVLDLLGIGGRA